jgi:hypothetical protein
MTTANEELRDILDGGIGPDIYLAERARELHKAVGIAADAVNEAGLGELFGAVQNAAVGELTLSIAKLFERPSASYSIRSIPAAIALLSKKADGLRPIQCLSSLTDFARARLDVDILRALSGEQFTRALGRILKSSCPDPKKAGTCDLSRALDALRTSRDKAIAHNESVNRDGLPKTKWSEAEALLQYARHVGAGLAMAYLGSAWTDDTGYFIRSGDARVAGSQLRRLLKAANISPKAPAAER